MSTSSSRGKLRAAASSARAAVDDDGEEALCKAIRGVAYKVVSTGAPGISVSGALPMQMRRTLKVAHSWAMPAATSAEKLHVLNSAYDPFQGDGDAQPQYFDQYMALYTNYCVLKANWVVTIHNAHASVGGGWVTAHPQLTSTTTTSYDVGDLITLPESHWKPITLYPNAVQIRGSVDIKKWLRINKFEDKEDAHGTANTDPTLKVYLDINVKSSGDEFGSTDHVTEEITMDVVFFNPKTVAPS